MGNEKSEKKYLYVHPKMIEEGSLYFIESDGLNKEHTLATISQLNQYHLINGRPYNDQDPIVLQEGTYQWSNLVRGYVKVS